MLTADTLEMNMKIILADDHAMVRDGMMPFLERIHPDVTITEAACFDEAHEAARKSTDLAMVILDLYMPGMEDMAGLIRLRAEYPALPIVILSGSIKPEDAFRCMELGATGFVPKTMRGETILGVLRLVLSGEKYVPPFMFEHHGKMTAPVAAQSSPSPISDLTPRELDILDMLVDGAPNKVIARALELQEVTVKAHLRNIFRKLAVANRTEAAKVALMAGITGRKAIAGGA